MALEGLLQSLAQGFGESYLTAYALWLGAGGPLLGLVSSLPTAVNALAQSLARRLDAAGAAAQRLVTRAWSFQALALAGLGVCAYLRPGAAIAAVCVLIVLGWGAGGLAVPAWTRLVSDTVPRGQHGWFFGLRGTSQQIGIVAAIVGGGLLIGGFRARGSEAAGFTLLFVLAALARAGGPLMLSRVTPVERPRPRSRAGGLDVIRGSRRFRRLATYLWALHLGTHAATPFFVPYMLADLGMSYATVGLLLAAPAVVKIATLRSWGRIADRFGPGPVLRIAGWLVAPVPALWLLSPSPWWILLAQVASGVAWGAFELAQASLLLQTTRGRANAIGVFNLIDGGAILAGSLIGGLVVQFTRAYGGSGFLAAMAASALLRMLAAAVLLHRVPEVGHVDWPHGSMPLRIWAIRPTRGFSLRPWGGPLRPTEDDEDGSEPDED